MPAAASTAAAHLYRKRTIVRVGNVAIAGELAARLASKRVIVSRAK
jgi:hypothetical protein